MDNFLQTIKFLDKKKEIDNSYIKYNEEIINEDIIFLINKKIINSDNLYCISFSREYNYLKIKDEQFKIPIIKCLDSNNIFINKSKNEDLSYLFKDLDMYEYFQCESRDFTKIKERENNFKIDDERRYNLLKKLVKDKYWLDFGCGYGSLFFSLKDTYKKCVGLDIMESCINELQNHGIKMIRDINELEDNSLDIITATQVVELLSSQIDFYNMCYKKLKKGGKLLIETNNSMDALLYLYKSKGFENFLTYTRRFIGNNESYKVLLEECNFKNIQISNDHTYSLANHLGWLSTKLPGNDIEIFNNNEINEIYKKILCKNNLGDKLIIICDK